MRSNKNIIPLDKYITKALYDKKDGYYMKKNPFGLKGDFITSPNISILFSEIITVWIILYWKSLNSPKKINIVEMGAGNAEMMHQIIKTSLKFSFFSKACNYYIYEKSPELEKIQKKKLNKYNIKWIKSFKNLNKAPTLFIGNEFFDALPIKQFIKKEGIWFEKYVDLSFKKKKLIEIKTDIKKYEKNVGINFSKKQNFIEFSPLTFQIIQKISKILKKLEGGLLIIDYGYLEDKMFDTLQAVKKHKKTNIFDDKKNKDISYMLNFKLIKKIVQKFNLSVNGTSSQRNFLISLGIIERAEMISKKLAFSKKADIYYRLKRLIDKNQMGELFKVMFVSKNNNFKTGFKSD